MENGIFWSEIGSGFGEPGGTPLLRITGSTPRAIELLKTSSDPQITNGVEGSEVKQGTVPMKGKEHLQISTSLLLFVKTAWNIQL